MVEKSCGICMFFVGGKPLPEGVPVPAYVDLSGECRRNPVPQRKHRDGYWCGEWAAREIEKVK